MECYPTIAVDSLLYHNVLDVLRELLHVEVNAGNERMFYGPQITVLNMHHKKEILSGQREYLVSPMGTGIRCLLIFVVIDAIPSVILLTRDLELYLVDLPYIAPSEVFEGTVIDGDICLALDSVSNIETFDLYALAGACTTHKNLTFRRALLNVVLQSLKFTGYKETNTLLLNVRPLFPLHEIHKALSMHPGQSILFVPVPDQVYFGRHPLLFKSGICTVDFLLRPTLKTRSGESYVRPFSEEPSSNANKWELWCADGLLYNVVTFSSDQCALFKSSSIWNFEFQSVHQWRPLKERRDLADANSLTMVLETINAAEYPVNPLTLETD